MADGFQPEFASLELLKDRVRPGDALLLKLAFVNHGGSLADRDYRVFVHIETPGEGCSGISIQDDHDPATPTTWWSLEERVELGARVIEIPVEQEEGAYVVHVGLFDDQDESRLLESDSLLLIVDRTAPLLEDWTPAPLKVPQLEERARALGDRIGERYSLQSESWALSVGAQRAVFELRDRRTGVLWTSNPLHERLGLAHLSRDEETMTLPIDRIERVTTSANSMQIVAAAGLPGGARQIQLELLVNSIEQGSGLSLSWRALETGEWNVDSVTLLDQALWACDAEQGAVIVPQWLGELALSEGCLPERQHYRSNDISMLMAGVLKEGSALLVSWTDQGAVLTTHAEIHDASLIAGRAGQGLSLELHAEHPTVELFLLGAGNYVDVAKAYRAVAERRGYRETWPRKRAIDERVARQEGAPVFRLECSLRKPLNKSDGADPSTYLTIVHSFEEVAACARHWREDLEIDRAQILLGGWNRMGYDSGHPDILPANQQCGGNEGLAACSEEVRDLGFLLGLHDNYQDIYEDSPSWDSDLVGLDRDGEMRAGGVWAGGQSWMVCTSRQLAFASRNLPAVEELFSPDFYFLDTTLTTRLLNCTHADHPMDTLEDRAFRIGLFREARKNFGLVGLEGAREWAVPHAYFFEGILTHRTMRGKNFAPVPIFPIVYGDCLNLLTLQGDRLDPGEPEIFLDHLLYGEMPIYTVGPGRYWIDGAQAEELTEAQLRDPRFVFARSDRGWSQELCTTDRLIKNTWEVISYLHRAIGDSPMTGHEFLRENRSAETTRFGDVRVTVNYSDEPLRVSGALLGRYGFYVESPGFVAFHALQFGGIDYEHGACFTLRSLDGEPLASSKKLRIFHAFGEPTVRLPEQIRTVEREEIVVR